MSIKILIQNKLHELAKAGEYYAVSYDDDEMAIVDTTSRIQPEGVFVNEVSARFAAASKFRRDDRRENTSWLWRVELEFRCEVTVEFFERAMMHEPVIIPFGGQGQEQQVILDLDRSEYAHPPRRDHLTGSKIGITFEAHLHRE